MSRRMTARWLAVGAAAAILALWATPALAADQTVTIQGFAFNPGEVTVTVGDTVTWTNNDTRGHTATADAGGFDTGTISVGASKTITFATAGTFAYHCTIHPDMTASIIVEAAAASPSPAASGGGTSTPPATESLAPTLTPSDSSGLMVASAVALLLVGVAALALLALRLRPAEEADRDD